MAFDMRFFLFLCQFEEPVSVAIPHCLQRNIPGREPVIKQLQPTGKWTELPTNDIVIEDMRVNILLTLTLEFTHWMEMKYTVLVIIKKYRLITIWLFSALQVMKLNQ